MAALDGMQLKPMKMKIGLIQLEMDHEKHVSKRGRCNFVICGLRERLVDEMSPTKLLWLRDFWTQAGTLIEENWVLCEKASGTIVGEFSLEEESKTLIHPTCLRKGLATKCLPMIMDYLRTKLGHPYVKTNYVQYRYADSVQVLQDLFRSFSHAEFARKFSLTMPFQIVPYRGFFGTIDLANIPSLRTTLSQRKYKSIEPYPNEVTFVKAVFPARAEDPYFRSIVEQCASSHKEERLKALKMYGAWYTRWVSNVRATSASAATNS